MTELARIKHLPAAATDAFALYDSLPTAILLLDAQMRVIYANGKAETLLAISLSAIKNKPFSSAFAAEGDITNLIKQARNDAAMIKHYNQQIQPRRSASTRVNLIVTPFEGLGLSHHMLVMMDELGVAGRMESQAHQREVSRAAGVMASMLAHEVKNPLSGIRGAAQLLEQSVPENDTNLTKLIVSEVDRIGQLLTQIEDFASPREPASDEVNIHEILHYVKSLATNGFAANIAIDEYYDPSLPPVRGDRDRLIALVLNLMKNAAEALASTPNARIRLQTSYHGGFRYRPQGSDRFVYLPCCLSIEDNGPGVPADILPSLFEPFASSKQGGKGLGLAIVTRIAADHGGVVEHERIGDVTRFKLMLPASRSGK